MSAREIARLVHEALKEQGCHVKISAHAGGWTNPSHVVFEANGRQHAVPFWDDIPENDLKTARALLDDVQGILTKP